MKQGSLRLNVGGKLLTNLLAETLSLKQFNLIGEYHVVSHMKDLVAYLCPSQSEFLTAMQRAVNESAKTKLSELIRREYVLPDFKHIRKGFLLSYESQELNKKLLNGADVS